MTALAEGTAVGTELQQVVDRLPADLDRWRAPGLELAAVRSGETVLCTGIGAAVLAPATPVTAQTLFHHGSCGKAFTGLLAELLAEEGVLDPEAPVRTYVPELRLPDPVVAERATIHDLLSHRAGLARNDLAWIMNPSWSREELVSRLGQLPLCGELRAQWQYSNFGYALAGLAMERASGTSYDELLTTRIFDPAGMHRTRPISLRGADPDQAEPYLVRDGVAVPTAWRVMPGMAPAGGVLTCAEDSVRWLLVQLGHGPIDADVVRRTHHLRVPVPPGAELLFPELRLYGYAMGWMVATLRGRRLLWHSGGIDGFTTYALFLPDDDIGVVASVNLHLTQNLPLAVVLDVADALLGESAEQRWTDRLFEASGPPEPEAPAPRHGEPSPAAHHLDAYVGTFTNGGYGALDVSVRKGTLAFRLGELPVDASHRHFDTWDLSYAPLEATGTVSFTTTADGSVSEAIVVFEVNDTGPIHYTREQNSGGSA